MADLSFIKDPEQLPSSAASDVKSLGWKAVAQRAKDCSIVAITNHGDVDVVVLSRTAYTQVFEELHRSRQAKEMELQALRRRFDEHLAGLNQPGAGDRLRKAMDAPGELGGKVKAGQTF